MNIRKLVYSVGFFIGYNLCGQVSFAKLPECSQAQQQYFDQTICKNEELIQLKQDIYEKYLVTQLMSNAPLSLVQYSQQAWEKYARLCKNKQCIQTQFEQRLDELSLMTNLNQSFTQHFIRYQGDSHVKQMTTLQLHQMDKNRIKIEGMQYRNPNNSEATRVVYLRSYTPTALNEPIVDLETRCTYQLERHKYTLTFKTDNPKCQRFVGVYKLYD